MAVLYQIHDRTQLLNALWQYQYANGYIRDKDVAQLAKDLGVSEVEIEGVISFYHFFQRQPAGKYTIYLNSSILSEFAGYAKIKEAFEQATGAPMGSVDPAGTFGFFETSCIGLSDQEPAALINLRPFVNLTAQKVHQIVQNLKAGIPIDSIADHPDTNIQYVPKDDHTLFFRPYEKASILKRIPKMTPEGVLEELKKADLRGLGGAFFPVHFKWDACRREKEPTKYIICNADEGEPGTFKDRVLMHTMPGLLLEGMILAGYVAGAEQGYIYLRAEYKYMVEALMKVIKEFRHKNWLGKNILGVEGWNFSIKLQLGGGSYVCGEETALMQSMEGHRGEPRPRQYFPTHRGFLQKPTIVNNVETLMAAARVIELGSSQVRKMGTKSSPGTKVLSIAGDCSRPGIYEIEWGMTLGKLLELCGAENTYAVQLSGPSGELVPVTYADRQLSVDDLRCGGSVMIFNEDRDLMKILRNYNRFFMHESCGICTPCRGGNYILNRQLRRIHQGLADRTDLQQLHEWGNMMKYASRCGLGKTAPNPIVQAIERFPEYFDRIIAADDEGLRKQFDMASATAIYDQVTNNHS